MGHSEDCRAQLATWSAVVSAYCIAPFLVSWLGSGTSRRGLPVMDMLGVASRGAGTADAGVEDVDVMGWVGVAVKARRWRREVVGLAMDGSGLEVCSRWRAD